MLCHSKKKVICEELRAFLACCPTGVTIKAILQGSATPVMYVVARLSCDWVLYNSDFHIPLFSILWWPREASSYYNSIVLVTMETSRGHLWSFRDRPHLFLHLFLSHAWVFGFHTPTILLRSLQQTIRLKRLKCLGKLPSPKPRCFCWSWVTQGFALKPGRSPDILASQPYIQSCLKYNKSFLCSDFMSLLSQLLLVVSMEMKASGWDHSWSNFKEINRLPCPILFISHLWFKEKLTSPPPHFPGKMVGTCLTMTGGNLAEIDLICGALLWSMSTYIDWLRVKYTEMLTTHADIDG